MFIEYRGKSPRVAASAFVAPNAMLIGDVVVGEESSIWFGVVLRADAGTIRIGARTSIEDNAVIHASAGDGTVIGPDVTVGHCAVLDDCTVRAGALIGSNAVVLNGAVVGANALVAAGSVVTVDEEVPEGTVAAGAPAKVRKLLSGRAAEWIAHSTSDSIEQARSYRRDNVGDPAQHELKSVTRRRRSGTVVSGA
jgi:carbonic anhydrase/acetyltransferase-like protein (isoleucine patch superfamily)